MSVSLGITVDTKAVERDLARLEPAIRRKVIPAAINRTADEALRAAKADLPKRFTIRNGWVAKGLRTRKATPTKLEGSVYHKDAYMVRQEEGGTKDGQQGGKVAVPILGKPKGTIRREVTPRSKWPSKLKNTFAVKGRNGETLIFQRIRPRGRRRKNAPRTTPVPRGQRDPTWRLMYVIKPSVRVKPRWQFTPTITRVVAERWGINVDGYLGLAIAGRL